jgi:histidinol phosphatase-like PHP family hydrolase
MTEDALRTDLHGHTLYSDGRQTPEAFVETRREHGLGVIAVSDHDTFAAVPAAAEAARAAGLTLVPAMEVTAFLHFGTPRAEQFHVLAYFPPRRVEDGTLGRTGLGERAVRVNRRWREFVLAWLAGLPIEERWYLDPGGQLAQLDGTAFPALQAFLDLVHRRNARVYEAFIAHHVRFWERDAELFGWTPEEAIEQIRADGGVDIVAHPVRVRDLERLDRVLAFASGHEVYTSRHKPEVAAAFLARARAHDKHWTASSDDHQHAPYLPPTAGTPRRTVERLLGA